MQLLAKFNQILYMGFRATLNFWKFKVALNRNHNPKALETPDCHAQPATKPRAPSPPQAPVTLEPVSSVERKII